MWYRIAGVSRKPISNPIKGGFYVGDEPIAYEQIKGSIEWSRLLKTSPDKTNTQEKLNQFLSNAIFVDIDGKKTYVVRNSLLPNPIVSGFWVYEKKKNKLGEIVSEPLEIPYEKPLNIRDWLRLLNTSGKNINAKNINSLKDFLTDDKFEIIDGKKFYRPLKRGNPIFISNPIDKTFYIDGKPIEPSAKMNQSTWNKLLRSDIIYDNPAHLKEFLIDNLIRNDDGELIYTFDSSSRSIMFHNPVSEGFYVGDDFIGPDKAMGVGAWNNLLNTAQINSNDPDSLKDFLNDDRRFRTIKNRKTYIPLKKSYREGLFSTRFNNYENDDITVKAGQYINVIANKTYYLYLDFSFKKNGKILLAVEINGIQHYGFRSFAKNKTYKDWQSGLERDVLKINYCHENNIPLLIFNHMLSLYDFKTIIDNLHQNPHAYDNYIPQPVIGNNVKDTSLEFIKRQIYSHLYPVFNNVISFQNDESKKRYIKDTLILISKLMGIYEGGIDKTDYINSFDLSTDLTSNYNICLSMYNLMYPDYPLDRDEKITYSDLSKIPPIYKEKPPIVKKPKETNLVPTEEFKDKDNVV